MVTLLARVVLGSFFLVSGWLKIDGGAASSAILDPWFFHTVAAAEMALGVLLILTEARVVMVVAVIGLAIAMGFVAWHFQDPRPCGCFGRHELGPTSRMLLLAVAGLLATWLLFGSSRRNRPDPRGRAGTTSDYSRA
ncbi:MAG: DoxX family protein [Planctomycetes bacterium]|jgi:hypothetical protein|nr:DoxX family protein [Planctomycetota bacterium]